MTKFRGHGGEIRRSVPPAAGRGRAVYARFEGANPRPRIEARGEIETRFNFFYGDDPAAWRSGVRAYREIVYHDLWPGIDLVFKEQNGRVSYSTASPSPSQSHAVRFVYDGTEDGFSLSPDPPFAADYSVPVDDPGVLVWSTYLGGTDFDNVIDLAVNSSGEAVVLGETYSADFPTTPGAYDIDYNGWVDVFAAKVSADGSSVAWSTYLGSSDAGIADAPVAIALDAAGNPVLTGYSSDGFPVTAGAYDTAWNGGDDVFVTKLSADGTALLWSTFVGGSDYEFPDAIVLYPSGSVFVTGATYSADFPTTAGAFDTLYSPGGDIFVFKLASTGAGLLWGTFVGGGEGGTASGIAIDASSRPVITGYATAGTFPTTAGAYDPTWNGRDDVFVAKLESGGAALVWSTFLGGSANDDGISVALDGSGNVFVAGNTGSLDFPVTGAAYDPTWNGGTDVFVSSLTPDGGTLRWSTFVGGSDDEQVWDLELDSWGDPVIAGVVSAGATTDFPTTFKTFDGSFNGGGLDGFVTSLDHDGRFLIWSSFIGGTGADEVHALALTASDDPVIAGVTDSQDFPTTPGAYGKTLDGEATDAFVAFLDIEDATGIEYATPSLNTALSCAPNPFNAATRVRYSLERGALIDLRVYDVTGRLVAVLDHGSRPAGSHDAAWDGRNSRGENVATGMYFVRLVAGGQKFERKVMMVR